MRERNYKFIDQQHQLDGVLSTLMQKDTWGVDVETTGKDPIKEKMQMLQIGRPEGGVIIDTRQVNVEPLTPFFSDRKIKKIGHNIGFDYKFIKSTSGIDMETLRCTYTAEKVIYNGKKFTGFSLSDLALEYMGVSMDKSIRQSFIGHTGPFTRAQIDYGEDDTALLLPIYQKQVERMTKDGVGKAFIIETEAIPAFMDMELSGLILDVKGWRDVIAHNTKMRDELEFRMRELVSPWIGSDLFGAPQINFASPQQVLNIMKMMRIRLPVLQPDGKTEMVMVTKTGDEVLKKLQHIEFCRNLSDWRSYSVMINTFGQSYIDAIYPETGKIHPRFRVLGTETGRPSSSSESLVNMLNIPKDNMFRHCFVGDVDEIVESDDYNGCESRIVADLSQDPVLKGIFNRGEDVHCAVASYLFNEQITKALDPNNYRSPAKKLNFGICYGQGPNKFYEDLNAEGFKIDRDAAFKLYYKYCNHVSGAVDFIKAQGEIAITHGFVSNINGRRRYFQVPRSDMCKTEGELKGKIAAIKREAGNFVIQSVNADLAKTAMAEIRFYIKDNGIRSQFMNYVYDEIVTRTHKDDHPKFHEAKLRIMRESAEKMIKSVPMLVDGFAGPWWNK